LLLQAYNLEKSAFGLLKSLFNIVEVGVFFYYGILPELWSLSGRLMTASGLVAADNEIVQSLVFTTLTQLINTIEAIPFNLYATFVIEER